MIVLAEHDFIHGNDRFKLMPESYSDYLDCISEMRDAFDSIEHLYIKLWGSLYIYGIPVSYSNSWCIDGLFIDVEMEHCTWGDL